MDLQNKVVWITGGASGLGRATACRFIQEGAYVAIYDRDEALGREVAAQLGPRGMFIPGDVTRTEDNQAALQAIMEKWGRVDVLVNSAGVGAKEGAILSDNPTLLEDFTTTIKINLIGLYDCLRLAARAMAANEPGLEGERGVIVNVSSGFYRQAMVGLGSYGASKAAVSHLTHIAALELGDLGIRVTAIAPGAFDTPILGPDRATNNAFFGTVASFPKRLGNPEEVADLIKSIVDNRYINGTTLEIHAGSCGWNNSMVGAFFQALAGAGAGA
jgi:NAD(P)-dependent dehydrogenase (short-subunit alcohol dehydrogenase family)